MDCVRTVLRMGAERSVMTYRRSIQEIPVEELELEEAEIEGVEIMYMVSPDPGRRRRERPGGRHRAGPERAGRAGRARAAAARSRSPAREFVIDCDMVLVAIGQRQDNSFPRRAAAEARPPRRAAPRPEPARRELPNVWAVGRLRRQSDQLHLLDRRGQARRRVDRRRSCAGRSPKSRTWRSPASRPSSSRRRTRWWPKASPSGA